MSFGTERLSDIFDGLPGGRGPSLDAYLAQTDDDSSSDDELNTVAFVAWMKQKAEAARQERQQLQSKEVAEKLSTVRKRPSKQTGSASSRSRRSANRQSEQGGLSLMGKSSRQSSTKQLPRKSFDVSEIGGRKISLEVKETDSDTAMELPSPSPSDQGTPEELPSTELQKESGIPEEPPSIQLKRSGIPKRSPGTQLKGSGIPKESASTQLERSGIPKASPSTQLEGSGIPKESPGTQLEESGIPEGSPSIQLEGSGIPEESPSIQLERSGIPKSSPSTQLEESGIPEESPGTQTEGSNTLPVQPSAFKGPRPSYLEPNDQATSTYVDVPSLKFDSTSSDDQGLGGDASRRVSKNASRHVSRHSQGAEDPHADSLDESMEPEAQDTTVKESMQSAPPPTVSAKRHVAKTTARKRKIRRVCMPKKWGTTSKKHKVQAPETGSTTKKELQLTISPLARKKEAESPAKRLLTKTVVLSPKSSAKLSRNQGRPDDSLNFHEVSPDPSPVASLTPPTALPSQRGAVPHPRESPRPTRKASVSAMKKIVASSHLMDPGSPSNTSATVARHESMKSMRENAISIIASITEDEALVDHSVPGVGHQGETGSMPPVSSRRRSDASSVVSGYGVEQTPSSAYVVTLEGQCDEDSGGDDAMVAGESDTESSDYTTQSNKGTRKKARHTALCYKRPRGQRKQSLEDVSVEQSQLTENQSEEDTGSELDDSEDVTPADISAVASRPVMLDGYTPVEKGIPLNRSQLVKTIGGHKYKYSPVQGRKGVTPGRRRTKRTRVPVLPGRETYVYTVDENVLHTVAGKVRPLEERNEDKQQQERKPKPPICRKPLNCLDMAFTETQDEEDSVATFPLQTVDGEQMEVEFLRHLSVCPKKTLNGSDAVKGDPVIISPMYANDSCSVGCIFINAKCAKPQQVTTGASLVFLLMSGRIEVEMQSSDQNYVKQIKPFTRFWIPEDITYSIQNVDKIPAELVYVRLKQQ